MSAHVLKPSLMLLASLLLSSQRSWEPTAPETFEAQSQVLVATGGAAGLIIVQVDRYAADADHRVITDALTQGGYPAFLEALRRLPSIGTLTIGNRKLAIRWARQQPLPDKARHIAVVTDAPAFFVGGGAVDAKPTAGFDVAVVEFTVDSIGLGKGTMAAAARVKAGGETGVEIEDYAGKRIDLVTVRRRAS